jgi:hypothetical protein
LEIKSKRDLKKIDEYQYRSSRVADPDNFDADPDLDPTSEKNPDHPDTTLETMRIRNRVM